MSQPADIIESNKALAEILFKQDPKIRLFRRYTPGGYGQVIEVRAGDWSVGPLLITKDKSFKSLFNKSKTQLLKEIR